MDSLLIYSAPGEADIEWLRLDKSGGAVGEPQRGALADAAAVAAGCKVIWVLKGEDVWLAQRPLPAGSRRQQSRALPYVLEEELTAEVDGLLFAHVPLGGEAGVAVTDRDLLANGLELLQQHGLKPRRILPDLLLLPHEDDAWTLKTVGQRVLLRTGAVAGFCCERANLPALLAAGLSAAGTAAPARLLLEGDPELVEGVTDLPEVVTAAQAPALKRFAKGLSSAPRLDFAPLLGSDGPLSRADRRRWAVAAGMAVLAVGLLMGERWLALDRLERHNVELGKAIEQVYLSTFPQARRVENARVQMQQKLDVLRRGGAGDGFLPALAGVVKQLATAQGLTVDGLEYRDSLLVLRLQGRDLQQLNLLKQEIEQSGARSAEIQSVNQQASGVSAQMKIREGRA